MAKVDEGLPMPTTIPLFPNCQHSELDSHSVISFLQRPLLLSSFPWPSSALRSENILRIGGVAQRALVPSTILKKPIVSNKLDGFTSFKATAVFKLMLNAHQFQAGRLIMVAVPMPQLLGHRSQFITRNVSTAQCVHHVQMDIAKDTTVQLEVPFVSPYNSFDLIDGKFDWAALEILVYSPLNQVGGCPLQCELQVWFKDIELGTATSGPMQQSAAPSAVSIVKERASEAKGKFTGALSKLGVSAVETAVGAIDRGLAACGWSKPIVAQPAQVFLNRPNEGFNLCDGVDQSLVLGMSGGNNVEALPGLCGTMQDETSFDVLKRIPQFVAVFQYDDQTTSSGDPPVESCPIANAQPLLWQCCVSPSTYVPACYYITPTEGDGVVNPYNFRWKQPTTLNYITSPFLYWTGSMVYTFKFVKTKFHSGRVEIAFHPFVNDVTSTIQARTDYARRVIVDLRDSSEVSLTIPFVSPQPWKRISTYLDPMNPKPPAPGRLKDITTGMISVRALTPLIANGQCSKKIEVLVEARAGDDFRVQAPVTSKFLPFSFQNPQPAPTQQSLGTMRTPALRTRMYTPWSNTNAANFKRRITGLADVETILLDISGDISQWNTTTAAAGAFDIITDWDPVDSNYPGARFTFRGLDYHFHYQIVLRNPTASDINFEFSKIGTAGTNDFYISIDFNVYKLYNDSNVVHIDSTQLPLPIASEGGGSVVRIDPASLPLDVKINQTPDNNVVRLDETQYPIRSTIDNIPLDVNIRNNPTIVSIANGQLPLKVDASGTTINTVVTNTPLPVSGEGGGGSSTVKIDPSQLPLWISEWDVAGESEQYTTKRRRRSAPTQQSVAASGILETRTRAMGGWMPPCITGNSRDAHRPDTTKWCAGEEFHSMRQLTRRFAFCMVNQLVSNASFPIQPVELLRPGALNLRVTSSATARTQFALYAPNTKSELSGSPLAFVTGMYAFYRGGVRFKVWTESRQNPPELISGNLEYLRQKTDSVDVISDNIENFMCPVAYETPRLKQFAEFQVPYYSPTVCSSIWSHADDNQFDSPLAQLNLGIPDGPIKDGKPSTDRAPIKVAVAGADDFDLHLFIGPPPVIDIGAIPTTGRILHYPPSGFTPTQKITLDPAQPELAATEFKPVPYANLRVVNNAGGQACPAAPASVTPQVNRVRRETPPQEGIDVVDGGTRYVNGNTKLSFYDSPN